MSKQSKHFIQCCECEHEQEVELADSLNVTLDPEAYDKAVNYEEMIIKCEKCGFKGFYDHPLLYHDMEKHFMIQYGSDIKVMKDFINCHEKMINEYKGFSEHYIMRVCDYYPDFVEKVMIFTQGYNDIAMEYYKLVFYGSIKDKKQVKQLHYDYHNNKDLIRVLLEDGKEEYYFLDKEMYNEMLEVAKTKKAFNRIDNYVVNDEFILYLEHGEDEPMHKRILKHYEQSPKHPENEDEE